MSVDRGNLRRTAISAVKGVQKKANRARLYLDALEVEYADELIRDIDVAAEQLLEYLEETPDGK